MQTRVFSTWPCFKPPGGMTLRSSCLCRQMPANCIKKDASPSEVQRLLTCEPHGHVEIASAFPSNHNLRLRFGVDACMWQHTRKAVKDLARISKSLFILQIVHRFHYGCTLHQDVLDLIRGAVAIDNVRIKCRMDLLQLLVQFLEVALLLRVCLQVKCK